MVKVVENGERICTVTLDGSESSVVFQNDYRYFAVQNNSDTDINISLKRGFSSVDDGVMTVVAGSSVLFPHMRSNVNQFFVKGTGKIQVCATNEPINPFVNAPAKSSGGGTEGDYYTKAQSDAKYVQASSLADIATSGRYSDLKGAPEKLPADGGNADTVGGHTVGCDVPENAVFTPPDLSGYAQKTDIVPYKMGMDFGMCTSAAETTVKSVTTQHKVVPTLGAVFAVQFNNAAPAKASLNINGLTGDIQYRGANIPNGVINAGDIVTFMYHSSSGANIFDVISIENGGNAKTVNGFTVGCNVPADAVFTPPDLSGYASKALYGDTTINVGRKAGSAVGEKSTAEGVNTTASGIASHAEGSGTTARDSNTHAEGYITKASGQCSHAEGSHTTASGGFSHAEGSGTTASGTDAHAEGSSTTASGLYSHAEGVGTIANNDAEHASGQFNVSNEDTLFSVGDGTDFDNRHNAFEITKTGGKLHDKDIAVKDDIINPNLLINPDFKINQRGGTSWGVSYSQGVPIFASQKYTVDRWRIMEGNAVITEGKFVLNGTIIQVLENSIGAEFTATVNVESGSATANYNDTTKTFTITGENATLNWAKLEWGNVATPFIPPDPATELMKCRRYYRTMCRGTWAVAVDATSVAFVDSFDVPMRIDPTAKILSPVVLNYCNGWLDQPDVTKMSIVSTNLTKMGACYIHVSGFNVTVGGTEFAANFSFKAATDNFIEFDAEIY